MNNSVVLITGGAGNIGSHIVDLVSQENPKKIIVVDNFFNGHKDNIVQHLDRDYFSIHQLDIGEYNDMLYIFEKYKPDYIFHQASMLIKDSESLPHKAIKTNIIGTFNLLDLSNRYDVKKMCFASSASVFGEPKYTPVDEDHPYEYRNFVYGWTKITTEMMFLSEATFPWIGFRYYNVYGERQRSGTYYTQVLKIFYDQIKRGGPLRIFGDGTQTMDMIHALDIARANILGMKSETIQNEFFNVGTGIETSVYELATKLMKILHTEISIEYISEDSQKVRRRKSHTEKIKTLLGFEPGISVDEGLKRYVDYLENFRTTEVSGMQYI
jgi:UDP-glucose 4-epimerase